MNLKFNLQKSNFDQSTVKFLGNIFSEKGVQIDPEKIEAINNLENPENVTELQRILGMVNYLTDFIPNFSSLTDNIRQLLKKQTEFVFTGAM